MGRVNCESRPGAQEGGGIFDSRISEQPNNNLISLTVTKKEIL